MQQHKKQLRWACQKVTFGDLCWEFCWEAKVMELSQRKITCQPAPLMCNAEVSEAAEFLVLTIFLPLKG